MSRKLETRGRKPKGDMTIREQKFLDLWINHGMTLTDAYMKLYPESRKETAYVKAWNLKEKIKTRDGFRRIMEAAGIGEEYLAKKHMELLNAKKTIYATSEGQITDTMELANTEVQMQALKHANELHGHIITKSAIDVAVSQGRRHWTDVLSDAEQNEGQEDGDDER